MRIDSNASVGATIGADARNDDNVRRIATDSGTTVESDAVDLSFGSVRVQQLTASICGLPDVRQEKIGRLAQMVREGSYRESSEATAEALMQRMSEPGGRMAAGR